MARNGSAAVVAAGGGGGGARAPGACWQALDAGGLRRGTGIAKPVVQSRCNGATGFADGSGVGRFTGCRHRSTRRPAHLGREPQMGTTPTSVGIKPITDYETARRSVEVAVTARRLQLGGLSLTEASNLTAHLAGLPPVRTGWSLRQVEHLLFLRSIVETGRLDP